MVESYGIVSPNEKERLAAVQRYKILDTPPAGALDRITRLATRLFKVPIALIGIADGDRIWFKSRQGLEVQQIECEPELFTLTDASFDSSTNPLVAGLGLRFCAAAPLSTPDGYSIGTICVGDFSPRQVTDGEEETLKELAALVMDVMELQLTQTTTQIEAAQRVLTFKEKERTERKTANRDLLTGLKNRYAFDIELQWHALQTGEEGSDVAVVIVNLDGLENVNDANDTKEHEQRDLLLKSFARALRSVFRDNDTAYHFSSSEFALLLPLKRKGDIDSLKQIIQQRLVRVISQARQVVLARVGASAGVAMLSESNGLLPEVVRLAEARMQVQKLERHCATKGY